MKVRIEIDTRTFVRFWLVVIGFIFAAFAIYSARTALIILGVSLFLALALNIPVSQISRRLPGKSRVGATALAYMAVVVLICAVMLLVVPPVIQQTAKFAQNIPSLVNTTTTQWHGLNDLIVKYKLQPQVDQALNSVRSNASAWAGNVGQNVVAGVGSLLATAAASVLVLSLTFLMLIEGPMWTERFWSVYRDSDRMMKHKKVLSRMYGVFTGYVTGQLTVSSIGAAATGLTVFILSFVFPVVPANLALPTVAIAFTCSLIPLFGSTIGGILITALLASNSIPAAITYLIYFVVYQQIENNFITPHIQAKKIALTALGVLTALTIGLYVFGLVGGIISIPIAGIVKILVEEYLARNNTSKGKDRRPTLKAKI